MFSAFKHHGTVLGIFNGKMAFKHYMEFSDRQKLQYEVELGMQENITIMATVTVDGQALPL